MRRIPTNPSVLILFAVASCAAASGQPAPVELGRIPWGRDYDRALAEAGRSGRPILALFDEIPGCATCRKFGSGPLSHPIVVDASRLFVTLAIYNNRPGFDERILRKFKEPAWNNPVVRFLNADAADLIPRRDRVWTTAALLGRMVRALEVAGRPVPAYLRLVAFEYSPHRPQTATFAMYCYWEGEKHLGAIDGVLGTRIGRLGGREVVEVRFDAAVLDYADLVSNAKSLQCANRVFAGDDAQEKVARRIIGAGAVTRTGRTLATDTQQQYHLAHHPQYHHLPVTALQATKINAELARGRNPDGFLSPGQIALKNRIAELLTADRSHLSVLRRVAPDRSETGLSSYARRIERIVAGLEEG